MSDKISVAMAVYNGSKYIRQQIDSILPQLREGDELIISYDESQDDTLEIMSEDGNRWTGLTISFIAMEPQRRP